MAILKLIFGRHSGSRQKSSASDYSDAANTPEGATSRNGGHAASTISDEISLDDQTQIPLESTPLYGQTRKVGRPTTISRPPPRADRVKSRLMDYGQLDAVLDELEGADESMRRAVSRPVGWLVVVEGPGTGIWFTLQSGLTSIGRAEDQTVCLNYGDATISRSTHASIAYEPADNRFRLGQGNCTNDILLNGTSLQDTVDLHHGDLITVGETTLRLAAFCDDRFAWAPIIDKGGKDVLSA